MNFFSYRISLYKLKRKRDKEDERLSGLVKQAEITGGREAGAQEYAAEHHELYMIDAEIAELQGKFLISKAQKKQIPTPPITPKDGLWESNIYGSGRWQLTIKGLSVVRKLIRNEKKERLEIASHWAGIIIGVIGALTGLLAVFLSMW